MDQRISLFRRPHKRNAVAIVNPMTGEQQTYQKPTQKAGGDGGRERERSSAEHSMKVHRCVRTSHSIKALFGFKLTMLIDGTDRQGFKHHPRLQMLLHSPRQQVSSKILF